MDVVACWTRRSGRGAHPLAPSSVGITRVSIQGEPVGQERRDDWVTSNALIARLRKVGAVFIAR